MMVTKKVRQEIDRVIKTAWLEDICEDFGRGRILREASLQCSLHHHLRSCLESVLEENNLFIYPEFYMPELKYRADMAVVEMDLSANGSPSDRVTDIAAVIELKLEGGMSQGTFEVIKADLQKMRQYAKQIGENCQCYFGIIYESECEWLYWLDRRSTEHWANGRMTELDAGYLDGVMTFEVNSYNRMNFQNKSTTCQMLW